MFFITVSLSLSLFCLALRSNRRLCDWRTGDARTCTICMFSGALLLLTDSLCVYPCLFCDGPFRETLFAAGKRPVHPRTFDLTYNREKPASHDHSPAPDRRRKTSHNESARLSKILSNQQDSREPARFSRTSKILSNQSDSFIGIPASESSGHSATASIHRAISLHSFPQLRDSVVSPHPPSRDSSGSFGFVGIDRVGPGPCLLIVV